MRRGMPWLIGAVLVVGAGVFTVATPSDPAVVGPFVQRGSIGDSVESRTLIAEVTDTAFADRIVVESSDWQVEGNWLVVTLAASAPTTEVDAAIQLATLAVDGRVFQATERTTALLRGAPLRVGTDTVGMLAFELPGDVDGGRAELRLTTKYYTSELDDLVAITLPLDDAPRVSTLEIVDPGWSTR
nr:hypothetical protein [uncultured Microbacterium sp.]